MNYDSSTLGPEGIIDLNQIFRKFKASFSRSLREAHFATGLLLTLWPMPFFIIYALSGRLLTVVGGGTIVSLLFNFVSALPLFMIFYEALFVPIAFAVYAYSENKKLALGMFYGLGATLATLIAMAIVFSVMAFLA